MLSSIGLQGLVGTALLVQNAIASSLPTYGGMARREIALSYRQLYDRDELYPPSDMTSCDPASGDIQEPSGACLCGPFRVNASFDACEDADE